MNSLEHPFRCTFTIVLFEHQRTCLPPILIDFFSTSPSHSFLPSIFGAVHPKLKYWKSSFYPVDKVKQSTLNHHFICTRHLIFKALNCRTLGYRMSVSHGVDHSHGLKFISLSLCLNQRSKRSVLFQTTLGII